jgi:hypothetical protein
MGVEGPTYRQDAKLSGHALSACRAAATAVGYPSLPREHPPTFPENCG